MEKIKYGNSVIAFEVVFTPRKTLGITVYPDQSVAVKAPLDTQRDEIRKKVRKRADWIQEQQRFFLGFEPRRKEYLFKSGESHFYLGRQYLLKITEGTAEKTKYTGRYLQVITQNLQPDHVQHLLNQWYRERAQQKIPEMAQSFIDRFKLKYDVHPCQLLIKKMKNRWGSCTAKGNLVFNPALIKAPKACVEYVIIHELCHLIHPNHSKKFYALQQKEMNDWKKWKNKLEIFMARR